MLIRCPTCSSGYDLASEILVDGRILRCAHCRDAWVHRVEHRPDGVEIAAEARWSRGEVPAATVEPRRGIRFPRLGLPRLPEGAVASLLAAALVVGGVAAVAAKARVVAAFPPSQAVFASLGLPVNLQGLGLADVRSAVETGDGPAVLTLEGRITNLRRDATAVPPLRIAVRDKAGRELYDWTTPAPKAQLAAGETVLFRSRLTAPPRDGQDLAVSFAGPAPERRRVAEAMPGDR